MAGLWRDYLKLTDGEVYAIVSIIKSEGSIKICDDCPLVTDYCETCAVKGEEIVHVLIKHYIPLVLSLSKKFASTDKRDELIGVGLLALVEAVSRIPKLEDLTNFSAYVNYSVTMQMKQFVLTDGIIKLKVNRIKGNEHLRVAFSLQENKDSLVRSTTPPIETREIIETVITNETEQVIFDCMIQGGYKVTEIAELVHKSPGRVSQIKGELIEKLTHALKD